MSRTRKVALFATVAALASALVAAMAFATTSETFTNKVKVSGAKHGTAKKPRPATFDTFIQAHQSGPGNPSAAKHTVVRFSKYFKFHGEFFPKCTQDNANVDNCPKGSKVGTGSAQAMLGSNVLNFTINAYNGPGGKKLELHLHGTNVGVNATIEGTVKKDSGPYGYKLDVVVPAALYSPAPGVFTPLTKFVTHISKTTKVKGKVRGYIENTGCPASHKWQFQSQYTFANNGQTGTTGTEPPVTSNYTAACK